MTARMPRTSPFRHRPFRYLFAARFINVLGNGVAPIALAAIIAGASCGDIVTAWLRATDSIWGTSTFTPTVSSSHPRTIGIAKRRMNRMGAGRAS